jgi:hypothetical protein
VTSCKLECAFIFQLRCGDDTYQAKGVMIGHDTPRLRSRSQKGQICRILESLVQFNKVCGVAIAHDTQGLHSRCTQGKYDMV